MLRRINITNKKYTKLLIVFTFFLLVNAANSQDLNEPVIKNEVEDKNITGADIQGAAANVVTILDLSGSMGRNHGNQQVGSWDQDTALEFCERERCGSNCDSDNERRQASHCTEVIANTLRCGDACLEGRCNLFEEIVDFQGCVDGLVATGELTDDDTPSGTLEEFFVGIYNNYCNGPTVESCGGDDDSDQDRINAVQDISNTLGLALCGSQHCTVTCNSTTEYSDFRGCALNTSEDITVNQFENCIGGDPTCFGAPQHGSNRLDVALSVFLDVVDADNSLQNEALCNDTGGQFDGTSPIACQDYLFTPFRNVESIILGDSNLPAPTSASLISQITDNDADRIGVRFQPMYYSGNGNGDACDAVNGRTRIDDQSAYGLATGGFLGGSAADLKRVWEYYRNQRAGGGTPLALILGFDDAVNPTSGNDTYNVKNDALLAFNNDMPTDDALDCRPQFTIVITDGDDSCSGDCDANSSSCTGVSAASNNSNRRSSIKAVSNLRSYFSRINDGAGVNNTVLEKNVKKEVITFVIGLGIDNPQSRRALDAMALAGGTHTSGIIRHTDPASNAEFGEINIYDVIPGDENDDFEVYRQIARGEGLADNPTDALLNTCGTPQLNGENAKCTFNLNGTTETNVFDNNYFNNGKLPDGETPIDLGGFAFFADNADELVAALEDILVSINSFATSGVAPTAPQSSINVSARDRMFLSILSPIESERLWQGRLALYGFVSSQITDNPGARTIIRKTNGEDLTNPSVVADISIFSTNGNLDADAKQFHWEAAKNLTERDLDTKPRRLLTADASTVSAQNSNVIQGDLTDFYCTNCLNNPTGATVQTTPEELGIADADVVALSTYPPEECDEEGDITDCTSDCTDVTSGIVDIEDEDAEDCRICLKGCLRDQVMDFVTGNTGIRTTFDPMGQPTTENSAADSFGVNCPNEETGEDGSLDNCSIRLGDIFHSTPVLVASPSPLFFDAGFQQFARTFLRRSAALYAGSNSGFVHAFHAGEFIDASEENPETNPFTQEEEVVPFFDEGNGFEVFGFAPPTFLFDTLSVNEPDEPFEFTPDYRFGDFKSFVLENNTQRSFFDGAPTISDVWVDAYQNGIDGDDDICPQGDGITIGTPDGNLDLCGREWHTVMASGLRNGGGAITALNITNFSCFSQSGDDDDDSSGTTGPACLTSDNKFLSGGAGFPEHLWTTYDADFGNTWSQPFVGRVRLEISEGETSTFVDRYVYFVGGGLDPIDTNPRDGVSKGNGFYVLDAPTGNILFKFHPDDTELDNSSDMVCDMAANLLGVDINVDGYTDVVYGGDTCGRLWRFDVSEPLETSSSIANTGRNGTAVITAPEWTGSVAFCTGDCIADDDLTIPGTGEDLESVYFAPTVAFDRIGRRHVIFVTGNRRNPSKIAEFDTDGIAIAGTNEFGRLYNFIDNFIPSFLAGGEAVEVDIKTADDLIDAGQLVTLKETNADGESAPDNLFFAETAGGFNEGFGEFVVEFPDNITTKNGEKGFGRPLVLGRVLVFTSFAPDSASTNPCIPSFGKGRLFALDYLTGQPALNRIPGAQQSILDGESDSTAANIAGANVAEGLPTSANLAFGTQGSAVLTIAFSGSPGEGGAQFLIWETPQKPAVTQTVFWEEIL